MYLASKIIAGTWYEFCLHGAPSFFAQLWLNPFVHLSTVLLSNVASITAISKKNPLTWVTWVDSSRLQVTWPDTSRVESSRMPFQVDLSSCDSTFRVAATLLRREIIHLVAPFVSTTTFRSGVVPTDSVLGTWERSKWPIYLEEDSLGLDR